MKKLIALLLALFMIAGGALTMTSCGKDKDDEEETEQTETQEKEDKDDKDEDKEDDKDEDKDEDDKEDKEDEDDEDEDKDLEDVVIGDWEGDFDLAEIMAAQMEASGYTDIDLSKLESVKWYYSFDEDTLKSNVDAGDIKDFFEGFIDIIVDYTMDMVKAQAETADSDFEELLAAQGYDSEDAFRDYLLESLGAELGTQAEELSETKEYNYKIEDGILYTWEDDEDEDSAEGENISYKKGKLTIEGEAVEGLDVEVKLVLERAD